MKNVVVLLVLSCLLVLNSCSDTTTTPTTPVVYDSTLYSLDFQGLPVIAAPPDNRLTVQGVRLGKMLFFETMLSKNGTQSCATCHQQKDGFSDIRQFSIGVENKPGKRQAMAIFNLAYHKNGLFWDGRAASIREQSLKPIQDPLEMNETLENVVQKLSASQTYRDQFIRAFGSDTITPLKISLALEQFELTLLSGNSLYDKSQRKEVVLTTEQERGRKLFFTEFVFDETSKSIKSCLSVVTFSIDSEFSTLSKTKAHDHKNAFSINSFTFSSKFDFGAEFVSFLYKHRCRTCM